MKISVVIPCIPKHIVHLENLLHEYENQTLVPNEIIISISSYDDKFNEQIHSLEKIDHSFHLVILKTHEKKYAGENRQIGSNHANGDIISYQDADDLPHPQRMEIIRHLFEKNPNMVHLLHSWVPDKRNKSVFKKHLANIFTLYNKENIKLYKWKGEIVTKVDGLAIISANGLVSIRRQILDKVTWSNKQRGEDLEFNREVLEKFGGNYLINCNLIVYRKYLSSSVKK